MRTSDRLELGVGPEFFDDRANVAADRRIADPDPLSDLPVVKPGREQAQHLKLAARQLSEQEAAFFPRPLLASPATSKGDDVRHSLQELHVVVGEAPLRAGVCPKNAERRSIAMDEDAEATLDTVFSQELRRSESSLRRKVANHDRSLGLDGIAGVGLSARAERGTADQTRRPSHAGAQQKRRAARKKLEDSAEFGAQSLSDAARSVFEQDVLVDASERLISEGRDSRLLTRARAHHEG